jgi:hypothetical protein
MGTQAIEMIAVAVCGGIAAGFGTLLYSAVRPVRRCVGCGKSMPRFRNRPANRRQMLWGGRTCPHCGCEMDWRGRRAPVIA